MTFPSSDLVRVLVVDDDAHLRKTLSDVLRRHGLEVLVASDARQALDVSARHRPEVALVDLSLPDASGMELIGGLHQFEPLTQVVVLTGYASIDSAVGALRHRVFDYLLKPVAPATMLATVARAGERYRLHRTERALRESESHSRLLLDTISDVVVALDAAGYITRANASLERVLQRAEVVGARWYDLVHPEDVTKARECIEAAVRGGVSRGAHTLRVMHRDGTWRLLEIAVAALPESSGSGSMLLSGRDVTERERLAHQLFQAQKLDSIGRMAGGVAHDFNNVLTAILGFTEILLAETPVEAAAYTDLKTVQHAAEHGASLSRQLLAFSKRQLLAPKVIDVGTVLRGMEPVLNRMLGRQVELVLSVREELYVRVDPTQLEQIVINLAMNARDAMPDGGTLWIGIESVEFESSSDGEWRRPASQIGAFVSLSARDTGHGMSAEVRERLFEPFFTTKAVGHGTGLGLPSVYGIVQQSGGHIEVSSEPGNGALFTVFLPRCESVDAALALEEVSAPHVGATVLVVEDQHAVRELMARTLTKCGHVVLEADTAERALEMLTTDGPKVDLLVTDAVLPGMSGPTLAAEASIRRENIRVLFVSGYSDDAVLRMGIVSGRDAFLHKPFGPAAFAAKIREVLA